MAVAAASGQPLDRAANRPAPRGPNKRTEQEEPEEDRITATSPAAKLTLVLGGARSGKSEVAERLAAAEAERRGERVTYLATGTATDADMAARIQAHRDRRPAQWATVECGPDLPAALAGAQGVVLVDSLGTWLADRPGFRPGAGLEDALRLRRRHGATVLVSEEVGLGVHPSSETGRRFRDALGELNRSVGGLADLVLLVVAGRVLRLEEPDE